MQLNAFTIGRTTSYEQAIREPGGCKKMGECLEESYQGGWVWKTSQEAHYFKKYLMECLQPSWKDEDFSVYELQLPNGWDVDVKLEEIADTNHAHFLLNDSQIVKSICT